MRPSLLFILNLLILGTLPVTVLAQEAPSLSARHTKPLTNGDIVEMVKAKFPDSTVLKTIQANVTEFDVSVQALVRLKNVGVSQPVIEAMLSATANEKTLPDAIAVSGRALLSGASELPEDVGVYVKQDDKLIPIEPEIVNWRTGGVLKTVVTAGIDKGHVNGTVIGPHSPLVLKWSRLAILGPLEFYIRCPEANSASEYQLLRLWLKGSRREFRAVTGGVLHMTGSAEPNQVQFKFEKIAPRTYRVRLANVEPGEYGFLAPGAIASTNAASLGKIYSFRIPE